MSESRFWRALGGNWVGELAIRGPQLLIELLIIQSLGAAQLGVWVGIKAAMQFASSLSGVPLAGLDLEYSYAMGRVDAAQARRSAGAAAISVVLLTAVTIAVLTPALWSDSARMRLVQGAGPAEFAAMLCFIFAQGAYNFFLTHLRNQLRFAVVNAAILLSSCATLAFVYLLGPSWGVTGVVLSFAAAYACCAAVWLRWSDLAWPGRGELPQLITTLLRLGAALAAISVALSLLRLIARWFIGQQFGELALGQYGVAATAAGVVLLAGGATSRVVMQFAARAEGAEMPREQQAIRFALLPGVAIAIGGAIASIGVAAGAGWLIPLWLPQHAESVALLRPVIYASLVLSIALVLTSAIRAQARQRPLILACLAATILQVILLSAARGQQWTLVGFACSEVISFGFFLALLVTIVDCRWSERWRFVLAVGSAILWCVVAIELAHGWSPPTDVLSTAQNVSLALAVCACWIPLGWTLFKRLARGPAVAASVPPATADRLASSARRIEASATPCDSLAGDDPSETRAA